jgi:hypothetical protein
MCQSAHCGAGLVLNFVINVTMTSELEAGHQSSSSGDFKILYS